MLKEIKLKNIFLITKGFVKMIHVKSGAKLKETKDFIWKRWIPSLTLMETFHYILFSKNKIAQVFSIHIISYHDSQREMLRCFRIDTSYFAITSINYRKSTFHYLC